nr:RteC domain-containing protein [Tenacibaculum piscium]
MLIYYNYVYKVEVSCPIGDEECLITHYKRSLKQISKNNLGCNKARYFQEYIRAKRTDKDGDYFTRGGNKDFACGVGNSFVFTDLKFTTCYDCIFSLLLGEEKYCSYIMSKIALIKTNKSFDIQKLNWGGSKNSMIELIYALSISNIIPQTNIRTIAIVFEKIFNMKLGDIHHAYHKMKYRTQSRTIFLDQLKDALTKHLNKGDI